MLRRRPRSGVVLPTVLAVLVMAPSPAATTASGHDRRFETYANPLDLPYRYQAGKTAYREAADPTVVRFKGRDWLFASHSHGYWWTTDLLHWTFVEQHGAGVEKYAPTAVAIGGRLFMATSDLSSKIWVTSDPTTGTWEAAADIPTRYWDPALFRDDDGRLYMYYGLSAVKPLFVEELDPRTFQSLGPAVPVPASRDKETRGWEVVGDTNELDGKPSYIEGSWMTKHDDRYYLEYSAPGTEWKGYGDGILTGDKPLGPFAYEDYNPFAIKATGFIAGAGHGSTFQGSRGLWWHIGTATISKRHIFERRLALFPAAFTRSGKLLTDTYLGDYPRYIDGRRELTGWMLLSRGKKVEASSQLEGFPAANAVDEDIRSWWSATSGDPAEWFEIDLGAAKRIEAVQINFADQDSTGKGISSDTYRYRLELSRDGRHWRTAIDRSARGRDAPHDYEVLPRAVGARFVRLVNVHSPDGGKFSLYDLRVFGNGNGPLPATVRNIVARRDPADGRKSTVRWAPSRGAEFYVVRLGTRPDFMTQSFQIYDGRTSAPLNTLNKGQCYYVTVDAVNDAGIRHGARTTEIR